MSSITIKDKQYEFIATSEDIGCDQCDLNVGDICKCGALCDPFHLLLKGRDGRGIFKELKIEK